MKKIIITSTAALAVATSANAAVFALADGNRNTANIDGANDYGTEFSGLQVGDSFYMQTTVTNLQAGNFAGFVALGGISEEIFFGALFNGNIGVGQNDSGGITQDESAVGVGINTDVFTLVLKATRGATAATDTFEYWVNPNLAQTEAQNTAAGSGTFTAGDLRDITGFDYIGNSDNNTWANSQIFTGGDTAFAVAVPEPSSTALLGLGGLALILRRRK